MNRNNEKFMPTRPGLSIRPKGGYPYNKQMSSGQSMSVPNNYIKQTETDDTNSLPPVITSPKYLQGYLRTKIGEYMIVNFLLGTGTFVDKDGVLKDVGVDHIVLRDVKTGDDIIADLYSIKFVEIPNEYA